MHDDGRSPLRTIFGAGGVAAGGIGFLILGFLMLAVKLSIIGFAIYFFLALAGVVPPVEIIPLIPYI